MAASTGDLPQDLIEDILSRLPVKSLLRFRCVHKSWYSLFKLSSFITTHFQNPNNKQHGLGCGFILVNLYKWINESSFKFLRRDTFNVCSELMRQFQFKSVCLYYVGSCNGLVCMGNLPHFTLYNFSLKQHKIIPRSNLPHSYVDYWTSNDAYGFGYDSKNNDYKIVMVFHSWHRSAPAGKQAEVYSLRMNSWRKVGLLPDVGFKPIYQLHYPAYLNGAIHWLGSKKERACVICFDVSSEIFKLFPLPDCLAEDLDDMSNGIDVYGDLLSVVKLVRRGDDTFFDIWVMREYGGLDSWIQLHSIQLFPKGKRQRWFRGFGTNRELLLQHSKGITSLCPDKELEKIEFNVVDGDVCSLYVIPYIESLVCLEEDNE